MTDVPNHDSQIIAVAVALNVLATVAVGLRMVSKFVGHQSLLLEDWLLIAAWMIAIAEHITTGLAYQWGLGRHESTLTDEQLTSFGKYILVVMICQPTTLALSKLSLLRLLHRIFITRAFHITVYVLSGIVVAWYIAILFADVFICSPVQAHWDPRVGGSCGNMAMLDVMSPLPWILTDFAILVAPLPLVWRLHLPLAQKLGVLAIFAAGAATTVVSCVRYKAMFFDASDMTWNVTLGVFLTIAEAQTAVICAGMVACKACFKLITQSRTSIAKHQDNIEAEPTPRFYSGYRASRAFSQRTSEVSITGRNESNAITIDSTSVVNTEMTYVQSKEVCNGEQDSTTPRTHGSKQKSTAQVIDTSDDTSV